MEKKKIECVYLIVMNELPEDRSRVGPVRSGPRSKLWQIFGHRSSRSGPVRSGLGPMNTPKYSFFPSKFSFTTELLNR